MDQFNYRYNYEEIQALQEMSDSETKYPLLFVRKNDATQNSLLSFLRIENDYLRVVKNHMRNSK